MDMMENHGHSPTGAAGAVDEQNAPAPPELWQPQTWRFEFGGHAGEYFKIWLVNLALTVVTLTLYAPWAKVRRLRYFYGNTTLGGRRFDFTGVPARILIGRLIALAVFAVFSVVSEFGGYYALAVLLVLLLVMPWLLRSSMRFRARNTKFGNSRFAFSASLGQSYWLFVKCAAVSLVSFGLLYPLALYWFKSYQIDNMRTGRLQFQMKTGIGDFYGAVLKPYLMMLAVMALLFGLMFAVLDLQPGDEEAVALLSVAVSLVYVVMMGFFIPLTQGYLFRAAWEKVDVGRSRVSSRLSPFGFAWVKFTNYVATVLTLGLMWPWAAVRLYRYVADSFEITVNDDPAVLDNPAQDDQSALGEELADVFDLDISL